MLLRCDGVFAHAVALDHTDGSWILRLAKIDADHKLAFAAPRGLWCWMIHDYPQSGLTAEVKALSITALGKAEISSSANSKLYSSSKRIRPSSRSSSSRNVWLIRGHSEAGTLTLSQSLPPEWKASKNHPRRPFGVLRAINLPLEVANIGLTAASNSSSTRAASSMITRATAAKPRTVFSDPGIARTRLPFDNSARNADSARNSGTFFNRP